MVSKPVVLGSFRWNSIKEAKAAFQHVLLSYELNERITDPTHIEMLFELLERHPRGSEKTGVGVDHFFIGRTEQEDGSIRYWNGRGIWIRRVDGSKEDLGYTSVLSGPSPKADAKDAMRHAVTSRRDAYRDSRYESGEDIACFLTGEDLVEADAQVIYVDPSWEQLTYRFAIEEGGWDRLAVSAGAGVAQIGGRLQDPDVLRRWLKFFDTHAHMELASRSAAARRPWPDETAWEPAA
ncbi:DCL family protein [Microbacterium sp. KSW4-16]|uniref:DCL family protein n=1 Tax=Microbacterium aurugineum TaxID=2851642 RepID=UPI0020C145BD|nr:DCL family protein [Microbacterium aurugineum]MCK8468274.1 DCL family protein [Microbacterium aurugineum]